MIHVDDEVAHLEIAEIREERSGDRAMSVTTALHLRALFLEDVRLRDDLQIRRGQAKPFGELADGDENRHVEQFVGAIQQHAAQVVLREQLHRPLRTPFGGRHEKDAVTALAGTTHLRDPFLNAAAKLHGRLTRNVEMVGRNFSCAIVYGQLFQPRGTREARREIVPLHEQLAGRSHRVVLHLRVLVAGGQLLLELPHLRRNFFLLGDNEHQISLFRPPPR